MRCTRLPSTADIVNFDTISGKPFRKHTKRLAFLLALAELIAQNMDVMKVLTLFAASTAIIMSAAQAADAWLTDFKVARAQAQAEQKPIVLDFTGSDWCGWCMTMRRMVLDTPDFYTYARNKFVLMEVDLPRDTTKMTNEQIRQNNALAQQYKVNTFPTVLVITADGQLIGGFTGGRTDLRSVAQSLDLAFTNAELLSQAATQSGVAKARSLKAFYRNMPGVFRRDMHELRKEIAELDPMNETGIHTELQDLNLIDNIRTATRQMNDDEAIEHVIQSLPKVSASHRGDLLQLLAGLLNNRIRCTRENADSLSDIESMRRDNLMIIELCSPPESRMRATDRLQAEYADPQAMLRELRKEREYRLKYKK